MLQQNQSSRNLIAGVFFLSHVALVYSCLGRYEVTTRRDLSIGKVLSPTVPASSLPLRGRTAVTLCPPSEAVRIQDETQMEEKPVGKEAHPTTHAAAGWRSPQLCPMETASHQSGAPTVTEATPQHWWLQALLTALGTLDDVFFNLKTLLSL